MIILDTSFIISLLNKRDVHHRKAIEILSSCSDNEGLGTHALVVQETVSVIARKSREQSLSCREWLGKFEEFINTLMLLEFSPTDQEILQIIADSDCELSYIDSVLVLACRQLRSPILTFDNALIKMCEA